MKRGEVTYSDQFTPWVNGYLVSHANPKGVLNASELKAAESANQSILKAMEK